MGKKLIVFSLSFWFVAVSASLCFSASDNLDLFFASYPCLKSIDPDESDGDFEKKERGGLTEVTVQPLSPFLFRDRVPVRHSSTSSVLARYFILRC